jgi:NAD(P)H-hydrate epimerase
MRVLNTAQMRDADRRTIEDIGIPSLVLMENAGRQAVAAMEAMYSDLLERQVAILCGRGNKAATASSWRARWCSAASTSRCS